MSKRADGRGHWPSGKRRKEVDAAAFVRSLHDNGWSWCEMARAAGISDRQIRRIAAGQWCSVEVVQALADMVCRSFKLYGLPLYGQGPETIDGNTRVGGVGEYTIRAADGFRFRVKVRE